MAFNGIQTRDLRAQLFLLSESNNPSKVKTSRKQQAPKAANSKSNKSYYFWKFMVHGYGKQLKQGTK